MAEFWSAISTIPSMAMVEYQCWLWNAAARAVLPSTLLGTLPVGAWLYMEGSLSLPVFLVALVVPLGFIAPLMKVSEAMEQVSMIKGNLEQVTAF